MYFFQTGTILCSFVQPSRLGVRCCRFSPDSSMLVTSGDDDSAWIWNISSRSLMKELRDAEHTVFCTEFTPDSSHLITTDANGDLRLWSVLSNHHKPISFIVEARNIVDEQLVQQQNNVRCAEDSDQEQDWETN